MKIIPKLPEGDYWQVEKDGVPEKGRTVEFMWWSRAPYNHLHVVARVSTKPQNARYGFLLCWLRGKKRLWEDAQDERQKAATKHAVKEARKAAQSRGWLKTD